MATPNQLYRERAAVLIRDLKQGTIKPHEVDEYILSDWDKDSDEYADAYGVTDFHSFKAGVHAILNKRPGGKKVTKKVFSSYKKKTLKKAIVKHEGLLAKLKRKWRLL